MSDTMNIIEAFRLYKEQVKFSVAGNEWNLYPMFHCVMSQLLRDQKGIVRYSKGGHNIPARCHFFTVQGSRCLRDDTIVKVDNGGLKKISELDEKNDKVLSYNFFTQQVELKPFKLIDTGVNELLEIELKENKKIIATKNHKFFIKRGIYVFFDMKLEDIEPTDELIKIDSISTKKIIKTNSIAIKSIHKTAPAHTFDLEVADNHNFILANNVLVHNSGKGELMRNAADVIAETGKVMGYNLRTRYLDGETTVQQLRGGKEELVTKGNKTWVDKKGTLETYAFLAWSEGNSLISPKSSYGDFKNVILAATDDSGIISCTARKDLTSDGTIPSFNTSTSLATGSVYVHSIHAEVLNSGLLQRFLFTFAKPSFETNIKQNVTLTKNLLAEIGNDSTKARADFSDFMLRTPINTDVLWDEDAVEVLCKNFISEMQC